MPNTAKKLPSKIYFAHLETEGDVQDHKGLSGEASGYVESGCFQPKSALNSQKVLETSRFNYTCLANQRAMNEYIFEPF